MNGQVRYVLEDNTLLGVLFTVFSQCQALHPDEEEGGEGKLEGRKRKNSEDQDREKAKRRLVPEEDEVEEDLEDGLFLDI